MASSANIVMIRGSGDFEKWIEKKGAWGGVKIFETMTQERSSASKARYGWKTRLQMLGMHGAAAGNSPDHQREVQDVVDRIIAGKLSNPDMCGWHPETRDEPIYYVMIDDCMIHEKKHTVRGGATMSAAVDGEAGAEAMASLTKDISAKACGGDDMLRARSHKRAAHAGAALGRPLALQVGAEGLDEETQKRLDKADELLAKDKLQQDKAAQKVKDKKDKQEAAKKERDRVKHSPIGKAEVYLKSMAKLQEEVIAEIMLCKPGGTSALPDAYRTSSLSTLELNQRMITANKELVDEQLQECMAGRTDDQLLGQTLKKVIEETDEFRTVSFRAYQNLAKFHKKKKDGVAKTAAAMLTGGGG